MKDHTAQKLMVLDFLKEQVKNGVPPSVREICAATGIRSTSSVHTYLKMLEQDGYITRDNGLNRAIHIVGMEAATQVPVLGKVTAGKPILAVEDIEGYLPFPDKDGRELFSLHVSGYSMRDAGILDGDYVVAQQNVTTKDGDIVVALIDDEATVKRLFTEPDGSYRLQPENPDFSPIYTKDLSVLGKVVAVMRYY